MPTERLVEELGAALPASMAALPQAELDALAGLLAAARREQTRALGEAVDRGLRFVPRLLRGPVTAILLR